MDLTLLSVFLILRIKVSPTLGMLRSKLTHRIPPKDPILISKESCQSLIVMRVTLGILMTKKLDFQVICKKTILPLESLSV